MLKELIKELKDAQTALEMESIYQNEIKELKAIIAEQNESLEAWHEKVKDLEEELKDIQVSTEVDLGMDTLYYRFKNGNLDIVSKFEAFLQQLQTIPGREL